MRIYTRPGELFLVHCYLYSSHLSAAVSTNDDNEDDEEESGDNSADNTVTGGSTGDNEWWKEVAVALAIILVLLLIAVVTLIVYKRHKHIVIKRRQRVNNMDQLVSTIGIYIGSPITLCSAQQHYYYYHAYYIKCVDFGSNRERDAQYDSWQHFGVSREKQHPAATSTRIRCECFHTTSIYA